MILTPFCERSLSECHDGDFGQVATSRLIEESSRCQVPEAGLEDNNGTSPFQVTVATPEYITLRCSLNGAYQGSRFPGDMHSQSRSRVIATDCSIHVDAFIKKRPLQPFHTETAHKRVRQPSPTQLRVASLAKRQRLSMQCQSTSFDPRS